jgi:hypothetical protein
VGTAPKSNRKIKTKYHKVETALKLSKSCVHILNISQDIAYKLEI